MTPPYFLIGFAGKAETGKAKCAARARGREEGVSGRPPGAVWHSACGCRGFLVEFCGPGRTDSPVLGLWGRQVLLLTDGCAVRGCGAPALGSAQPGSALTSGLRPHLRAPPTTPPTAQRSRAALGHLPQRQQRVGRGGEMRSGDAGRRSDRGVGQRGRDGGVRVGVQAGARGRAWPGCAHHCAHVFGACTRVCVTLAPHTRGGVPVSGRAHRVPGVAPSRELPEPPGCRCRGARVRLLLPLFGHFGPVQSARGGRARPPRPAGSRPVSPGPAVGPRSAAAAAP